MELRHLRYFVAVAKDLNFSRAAEDLYISQPALSRQIRNLENELGMPLFLRQPNGLVLTEAGSFFLEQATDILRRSEVAVHTIQTHYSNKSELLAIGYIPAVLPSFLCNILRRFGHAYPKVSLHFRDLPANEQVKALRNLDIDIAFMGNPPNTLEDEFEVKAVKPIPLIAVLPDNHWLAQQPSIHLADLAGENFIGLSEATFPSRNERLRRTCRSIGFTPNLLTFADTPNSVIAFVAAGRGVSLMPLEVAALPNSHVVFKPLRQPVEYSRSAAVWRKETLKDPLRDFLTVLSESIESQASE